jgi:adenylyltransferase/sulfurtransferase
MLTKTEIKRYNRHLVLNEIGEDGQIKLKKAKVLIVGAGGLGSPVLLYLTAVGVGNIGLIDGDRVDLSNLQRQTLYGVDDLNEIKVEIAKKKLSKQNPEVKFDIHPFFLRDENALEIFQKYDIIVDATDNIATRYLINDTCVKVNKPFVYGSVFKFEGQFSVFNYKNGPTYRCLFQEMEDKKVVNPSDVGLIGVLPGIIGCYQANEVIKIVTNYGKVSSGIIEVISIAQNENYSFKVNKAKSNI